MSIRFDRIHERDRRTDTQIPHDGIGSACVASRGKKTKKKYFFFKLRQGSWIISMALKQCTFYFFWISMKMSFIALVHIKGILHLSQFQKKIRSSHALWCLLRRLASLYI